METRTLKRDEMRSVTDAAERFYSERIAEAEKSAHRGEFVAIDPSGGRYAFGRTPPDALHALGPASGGALPYIRPVGFTFRLHAAPRA